MFQIYHTRKPSENIAAPGVSDETLLELDKDDYCYTVIQHVDSWENQVLAVYRRLEHKGKHILKLVLSEGFKGEGGDEIRCLEIQTRQHGRCIDIEDAKYVARIMHQIYEAGIVCGMFRRNG